LNFSAILSSRKSQTYEEKIYNTANEIINAILDTNTSKFISLIGVDDLGVIGKNKEMIDFDIKKYQSLFLKYLGKSRPNIQTTELCNSLGQKLVRIPIYKNNDTIPKQQLDLHILFGPSYIAKLNKITGYELITNSDDSLDFRPYSYWHKSK